MPLKQLLSEAIKRLGTGETLVLVSVIESHGSVPRGPGARMLVGIDGRVFGTVGGGTLEFEAERLARNLDSRCVLRNFTLRNEEAAELGMVCGGDMRLLFQRLSHSDLKVFEEALAAIASPAKAFLLTSLDTGAMRIELGEVELDKGIFAQQIDAGGTVYLFGGGHVAQEVVSVLAKAEFRSVVLDDRAAFVDKALFPDAAELRLVDFSNLEELSMAEADCVAIMTRGHQYDQLVLEMVLKTSAGYIGMMGSRNKREKTFQTLREKGFAESDIERVHTPIGLSIGAETPYEIAISIAGELIQHRAH